MIHSLILWLLFALLCCWNKSLVSVWFKTVDMVALSFKSLSILIALILRVSYSDALLFSRDLPCDFLDSVNITGGVLHSNNSFIFNGIEFTVGQYTKVNYIVKDGQFLIVEPYYRGCPCKNKPCIRLCCPYASFVVSKKADGEFICRNDEAARRIEGEIINENNETEIINFEQHFGFVERVCINHYYADEFQITHVSTQYEDFYEKLYLRLILLRKTVCSAGWVYFVGRWAIWSSWVLFGSETKWDRSKFTSIDMLWKTKWISSKIPHSAIWYATFVK